MNEFYQFPYPVRQRVPSVTEDIIPISEQRNGRSLLPKEEQPGHTRLTGAACPGKGDQDELSHYDRTPTAQTAGTFLRHCGKIQQ